MHHGVNVDHTLFCVFYEATLMTLCVNENHRRLSCQTRNYSCLHCCSHCYAGGCDTCHLGRRAAACRHNKDSSWLVSPWEVTKESLSYAQRERQ